MLGGLVGSTSCAADGSVASRNPLSQFVNRVMDTSSVHTKGQMVNNPSVGQHVQKAQGADAVHRGMAEGLHPASFGAHRGMTEGLHPASHGVMNNMGAQPGALGGIEAQFQHMQMEQQQQQMHIRQQQEQQRNLNQHPDGWTGEFLDGGNVANGPVSHPAELDQYFREAQHQQQMMAMQQQQLHHHRMQQEAAAASAANAWAMEYANAPPPPPMQMAPVVHQNQMDSAWSEAGTGAGGHETMQQNMSAAWQEAGPATAVASSSSPQMAASAERTAQDAELQATTGAVVEELKSAAAEDPRFAHSEFVKFMKGLNKNELRVEGNKVVEGDGAGGGGTTGDMEHAWGASSNSTNMSQAWEGSSSTANLAEAWQQAESGMTADQLAAHQAQQRAQQEAWEASQTTTEAATAAGGVEESKLSEAWDDANTTPLSSLTPQQALDEAWTDALRAEGEADLETVWERAMQAAMAEEQDTFEEVWSGGVGDIGASQASKDVFEFQSANPLVGRELGELYELAREKFEAGELGDAILAYEAIVQREPDDSEAWRMLGQAFAEQDEDRRAIQCLERAVQTDAYNLDALQALGVSYVNELDSFNALKTLKAWLQHNPKYSGLTVVEDEYSDGSLMDELMQLMRQAVEWDAGDSDAQVVMGVLYNVSRDFDSAIASFRAALETNPNDYTLWNKLGATLANFGQSGEALPAYDRALELKPRFARGWLNRGIALANECSYMESSRCYLQALSLNPSATHIWSYLRIALSCADRQDLVARSEANDIDAFRDEFQLLR